MTEKNKEKKENKTEGNFFENLEDLRIGQNFLDEIGVRKKIITVPVRKPNRQEFIRVHPDESYHLQTAILEIKEDRENYVVNHSLWESLANELIHKMLYTTINRQGVLSLWPVRMPDGNDRLDPWNNSAHEAAKMGKKEWVRIASNRSLGAYEIFTPQGDFPDPEWPEIEFREILDIAFRDRIIKDENHPVLMRLKGQI
jgi:hypothetical protein